MTRRIITLFIIGILTLGTSITTTAKKSGKKPHTEHVINLTDDHLLRPDMANDKPVVIDFTASWGSTCRLMIPAFEKVAKKHSRKVTFYAVDADQYPETALAFGVTTVPTTVFISSNGTVTKYVGTASFMDGKNAVGHKESKAINEIAKGLEKAVKRLR